MSIQPKSLLSFLLLAVTVVSWSSPKSFAEVRLLTGDALNAIHGGGGKIMDVAANGNLVLFQSEEGTASSPGIGLPGLYLRNITAGTLDFVNLGTVTNSGISEAEISDNGRYITWATVDSRHVYWRDRQTGVTRWITEGHQGEHTYPKITADGRYVAFASNSRTLISNALLLPGVGFPAVYRYDSQGGSVQIISLTSAGQRISTLGNRFEVVSEFNAGRVDSYANFDITPDGKYVVFSTDDQVSHPDRQNVMFAGYPAILRRNISSGSADLVNRNSLGAVANGLFRFPRISADGNSVVFQGERVGELTNRKLIDAVPFNANRDLYVKTVNTGQVHILTAPSGAGRHTGALGNDPRISGDGKVVVFSSTAGNLVSGSDPSGGGDVFRADLAASGASPLTLITEAPDSSGNVAFTDGPFVSQDGKYVAFSTRQYARMGFPGASSGAHGIGVGELPVADGGGDGGGGSGGNRQAFNDWASVLPLGERGPNDNPSKDGIPNLVKYFIGSDATKPDLRFLPKFGIAVGALGLPGDTNRYITLTVRIRRNLPVGYVWQVQAASTMEDFSILPAPTLPISGPVADGDFDIYTFAAFDSIRPLKPRNFLRLVVSLP